MKTHYILWDLDGTLVNSEEISFKAAMFREASLKHQLTFDPQHIEFIGREAKHIFQDLLAFNKIDQADQQQYWDRYDRWYEDAVSFIKEHVHEVSPRENILEVWSQLSSLGYKHAVVTSSREDVARAYLQNIGLLDSCELLTCINHVSKPKPDPEPYLLAMQRLDATAEQCIAVEDSVSGISAAKSAELRTIAWILNPNHAAFSQADVVTERLHVDLILNAFQGN